MISTKSLINALQSGTYDNALSRLYALDGRQASLERARERAIRVAEQFANHSSTKSAGVSNIGS